MDDGSLRFKDATLTHPGKVRSDNEDQVLARPDQGLWAVADGMGGHANGKWSSKTITTALEAAILPSDFDDAAAAVAAAVHDANERIWIKSAGKPMGSTVVALLLRDRRFVVLWAGDSRCYLLRAGELYQLTVDHSQVQEMVTSGRLTPEEAENHPMSHVLSRAVGVAPRLELDAVSDEAKVGDVFLVCSDGLTRTIPDAELATMLAQGNSAATADDLVKVCLERGAPDNVSVVVVNCDETTLLALA
jgi:serine/threonine protein phosphatase PrpC